MLLARGVSDDFATVDLARRGRGLEGELEVLLRVNCGISHLRYSFGRALGVITCRGLSPACVI